MSTRRSDPLPSRKQRRPLITTPACILDQFVGILSGAFFIVGIYSSSHEPRDKPIHTSLIKIWRELTRKSCSIPSVCKLPWVRDVRLSEARWHKLQHGSLIARIVTGSFSRELYGAIAYTLHSKRGTYEKRGTLSKPQVKSRERLPCVNLHMTRAWLPRNETVKARIF